MPRHAARRVRHAAAAHRRMARLLHDPVACRKTVLPGGLRVISERIPWVHSVALGVWINAGSRDENPSRNGIAHFIEHAVFKGTRTRKTHHIAQYLEAVGGYVNAFTGKDSTCYYARVLDRHLARAVDLLSDLVCNPAFPVREMEREKDIIIDEMRGVDDDPEDIINDHLEKLLFGTHPLGMPVIGEERTVRAITGRDLTSFVRTHYTAASTVVAASGNVDHDELVELCRRALDLPSGAAPERTRPAAGRPRARELRRPVQQAHLLLGRVVPGLRHPSAWTLSVLSAALGEGMSSRLFQRIRERAGASYNVYSFSNLYEDAGVFGIYAGGDEARIDRTRRLIEEELEDLAARTIPARELNRAREQVIGSLLLGLEGMSARMNRLGRDELVFGRDVPVDHILETLYALTAEDVRRLAERICDPGRLSSILMLPDPAASIRDDG